MSDNPMPAKIVEAISAVMAKVPKLNKGEKNSHGNYNFASIDDFLEAVRPLMAESGIVISVDEDSWEVMDKWLSMRFLFTVHVAGESYGPLKRSVMILSSMGAQAFGSGQSYAEKNFLRSLFKIATGEGGANDADSHPQEQLARGKAKPAERKGLTIAKLKDACSQIKAECGKATEKLALDEYLSGMSEVIAQVKADKPDWLTNPDYGLDGVIRSAYERIEDGEKF